MEKINLTRWCVLVFLCLLACSPKETVKETDDPPITYTLLRNGILDGQDVLNIRYQDEAGGIQEVKGYLRSSGYTETVLIYTFNQKAHAYTTQEIAIKNLKKISRAGE